MQIITALPGGREFTLTDGSTQGASFGSMSKALTENDLLSELVRQGLDSKITKDLIARVKQKGTEIF